MRTQLLAAHACILKRAWGWSGWTDDDRRAALSELEAAAAGGAGARAAAVALASLEAVVSEFAPATASPLGQPWEYHERCRASLQREWLPRLWGLAVGASAAAASAAVGGGGAGGGGGGDALLVDPDAAAAADAALSLASTVLSWDFHGTGGRGSGGPHGGGGDTPSIIQVCPTREFRDLLLRNPAVSALLATLPRLQAAARGAEGSSAGPQASRLFASARQVVVLLCSLDGIGVFPSPSASHKGGSGDANAAAAAAEAAAAEARRALASGDRVGLVTVDGRILAHVAPGEGAAHMIRVYDALLGATEVVDHDLTDVDDEELVVLVARYLRHQDGIDFASPQRAGGWDLGGLVAHASRALEGEQAKEAARGEVLAPSPVSVLLRRFCRARGIPLPYRPDPRDGAKAPGLATALREAAGRTRVPRTLVVMTDFDGIGDPEPLVAAVKLLRAHGHALVFVAPDARHFADAPARAVERDLALTYGRGEERRLREARALFGKLGAPVFIPKKDEPAALVIARARAAKLSTMGRTA